MKNTLLAVRESFMATPQGQLELNGYKSSAEENNQSSNSSKLNVLTTTAGVAGVMLAYSTDGALADTGSFMDNVNFDGILDQNTGRIILDTLSNLDKMTLGDILKKFSVHLGGLGIGAIGALYMNRRRKKNLEKRKFNDRITTSINIMPTENGQRMEIIDEDEAGIDDVFEKSLAPIAKAIRKASVSPNDSLIRIGNNTQLMYDTLRTRLYDTNSTLSRSGDMASGTRENMEQIVGGLFLEPQFDKNDNTGKIEVVKGAPKATHLSKRKFRVLHFRYEELEKFETWAQEYSESNGLLYEDVISSICSDRTDCEQLLMDKFIEDRLGGQEFLPERAPGKEGMDRKRLVAMAQLNKEVQEKGIYSVLNYKMKRS